MRTRLSWNEGLYSPPPFSLTTPCKARNVMNGVAFILDYSVHMLSLDFVLVLCRTASAAILLLLCRAASVATISYLYVNDLDPSSPCLVHVIVFCIILLLLS